MEIPSLLNEAARAAEKQSTTDDIDRSVQALTMANENERASSPSKRWIAEIAVNPPSRGRTPWDANGYVLPWPEVRLSSTPSSSSISSLGEPASPVSPRHKFSNSHSSITSSMSRSTLSHSRISSISTTGGAPTPGITPGIRVLGIDSDCRDTLLPDPHHSGPDGSASPTVMKRGIFNSVSPRIEQSPSPSNIPSPNLYGNRKETKDCRASFSLNIDSSKTHGRASSAPNPPANDRFYALHSAAQPTITRPDQQQQMQHPTVESVATPPYNIDGVTTQDDSHARCMYDDNCDTGSTLRKAISHIFGRNKLCTRMIPDHVWVHYCRKHYQRCRYRNPHEYAKVQCDLVVTQIRRIHDWSNQNKENGRTGVVRDWTLAMRKREKHRVENNRKKRSYSKISGEEDNSDSAPHPINNCDGAISNGTALPEWLSQKCADGYSTAEIEGIILQLREEIIKTGLNTTPDIEILPNISTDSNGDTKQRAPNKRQTSTRHPRKRSDPSGAVKTYNTPQPPYWGYEHGPLSADGRRQFLNAAGHFNSPLTHGAPIWRSHGYSTSQALYSPIPHMATHIPDRSMGWSYYGDEVSGPQNSYSMGPLPVPAPIRPETGASSFLRRSHQRSVSDFPSHGRQVPSLFPANGLLPEPQFTPGHILPTRAQSRPFFVNHHRALSIQDPQPPTPPDMGSLYHYSQSTEISKHSRHQSTPNAVPSAPPSPKTPPRDHSYPGRRDHGDLRV